MRALHTNGALAALVAAGVVTALLFGSVTAAHATAYGTPISQANALAKAKDTYSSSRSP